MEAKKVEVASESAWKVVVAVDVENRGGIERVREGRVRVLVAVLLATRVEEARMVVLLGQPSVVKDSVAVEVEPPTLADERRAI